ncbi:MAG: hypothetical protein H8D23_36765 [Candidatus Brocadiales bacterium]|nr:hypothetical protein [Candidatus Brocadiales bacterium]
MLTYKKAILLLAISLLLAPGFLPHGFINSNKAVVNNLASHAELCCCGNIASTCSDCCCSEDNAGTDNAGKHTVTITACGGTSNDIITVSKPQYHVLLSAIVNYLPVTTLAKAIIPGHKDVLLEPPYKPPRPQFLTNFT